MFILLLKASRPHQWVKNVLLFAPFVLAHQLRNGEKYPALLIIFVCMCLTASAIYLVNDLFDREDDRHHPDKKNRPIASGALPPVAAWCAAGIMLAVSLAAAARFVGPPAAALLACYGALSLSYTIALKRLLMVDVIVLSFIRSGSSSAALRRASRYRRGSSRFRSSSSSVLPLLSVIPSSGFWVMVRRKGSAGGGTDRRMLNSCRSPAFRAAS